MQTRSLSTCLLRTSGAKYRLQFTNLYRLTSRRGYSIEADNPTETQANDTQTHTSANESINNNGSSSTDVGKRSSFANRRRVNRELQELGKNPKKDYP
jgi:hypothetical protein